MLTSICKVFLQKNKIALITDLHFGNTMNQEELQSYCHEISQQNVDIVLLGGDIVDERSSQKEMQQAFETLERLRLKKGFIMFMEIMIELLILKIHHFHLKNYQKK